MYYRMPDYYNKFSCIADQCPATCCESWSIVIDDKTMAGYRKLPQELKTYILSHVDEEQQVYKRLGDRCSFLNESNLCDLYIHAGEDKFCKTCRRYPRHFEEYGNLIEAALSLSCPEAARIMLENPAQVHYKVRQDDRKSPHASEVDEMLLNSLLDVRKCLFKIIGDRSLSIPARMDRMLCYSAEIQKPVYEYEWYGPIKRRSWKTKKVFHKEIKRIESEYIYAAEKTIDLEKIQKKVQMKEKASGLDCIHTGIRASRYSLMQQYLEMLQGLEDIHVSWPEMITEVKDILYGRQTEESYDSLATEFEVYMKNRSCEYEHLLNYFIYTYFLGGVYDYRILSMTKLSILSTVIIREIGFARWLKQNKTFKVEDQIEICYRYSRQIEHSDHNLISLEGILEAHPLFAVEQMRKVLE